VLRFRGGADEGWHRVGCKEADVQVQVQVKGEEIPASTMHQHIMLLPQSNHRTSCSTAASLL